MTVNPNSYPAGLRSASQDHPPTGINVKVLARHHNEALDRQLAVFRGYPRVQGLSLGVITTTPSLGLFVSPPGSKSIYVHFATTQVFSDTIFSVSYNGTTISQTIGTDAEPFEGNFSFGPFNLASGGPGDYTSQGIVQFVVNTGSITVFDLWYAFSINTI